eukprot:TRINITY_DN83034_c0_g1_i1.p1 TRINITY_DN83034_c0_g1~~TRINITY_DN83034_c0_g1_i1.p1  ORF type:complete len:102 (-),score=10.67 TRINITY_DN83034_c0_g1_i1:137-442(-)
MNREDADKTIISVSPSVFLCTAIFSKRRNVLLGKVLQLHGEYLFAPRGLMRGLMRMQREGKYTGNHTQPLESAPIPSGNVEWLKQLLRTDSQTAGDALGRG